MSAVTDKSSLTRAIVICALGYFIDVFDIQLFAVLRVPSLTELGVPQDRLAFIGGYIFNAQVAGMILGAFLWGWLGDRFGRVKALYGSILIYSIGTFACSFVHDPLTYGLLRVFTGFGLAGETGAAITMMAEMISPQKRTWGIITVAGIGFLGPVFAILISWFMSWRETYILGGVLGLVILLLRVKLREPALFERALKSQVVRGSLQILMQRKQALTVLAGVVMGGPLAYGWFLLNFFSAEFSRVMLAPGENFNQKLAFLSFYLGTACGDVMSGAVSQYWRSRRKAVATFLLIGMVVAAFYLGFGPTAKLTTTAFYRIYFVLGAAAGCWVIMTAMFAEHFGTNIRATTAILLTNFVRGVSIPMIFAFQWLKGAIGLTEAALIIGAVLYMGAFFALSRLRETHGLDLDYIETVKARAEN